MSPSSINESRLYANDKEKSGAGLPIFSETDEARPLFLLLDPYHCEQMTITDRCAENLTLCLRRGRKSLAPRGHGVNFSAQQSVEAEA